MPVQVSWRYGATCEAYHSPSRRPTSRLVAFWGRSTLAYLGFCRARLPKKPLAKIRSGFLGRRAFAPTGLIPIIMSQKATTSSFRGAPGQRVTPWLAQTHEFGFLWFPFSCGQTVCHRPDVALGQDAHTATGSSGVTCRRELSEGLPWIGVWSSYSKNGALVYQLRAGRGAMTHGRASVPPGTSYATLLLQLSETKGGYHAVRDYR